MDIENLKEDIDLIIECQKRATGANTHSVNCWLHRYRSNLDTIRRRLVDTRLPQFDEEKQNLLFSRAKIAEKNLRQFLKIGEIPHL